MTSDDNVFYSKEKSGQTLKTKNNVQPICYGRYFVN